MNEERAKVKLRRSTKCRKCGRDLWPNTTAMGVAWKADDKRHYAHECPQCARDWHA